jgi:hypothetical protein
MKHALNYTYDLGVTHCYLGAAADFIKNIYLHKTCRQKYYFQYILSFTNSNISPGWHFKYSQILVSVEKRMALAFPVFKIDKFWTVIPINSARS